jgi:hypothetical protein
MIGLMTSILKMPLPWVVWVACLMTVNFVVPLFYIQTLEAQLAIAVAFVAAILLSAIHVKLGFVRLLGLGHVFWIPLVIWFGFRLSEVGVDSPFGIWLASLVLVNSVSLVIDVIDVARYVSGERSPTV